jgi:hypothetical protein
MTFEAGHELILPIRLLFRICLAAISGIYLADTSITFLQVSLRPEGLSTSDEVNVSSRLYDAGAIAEAGTVGFDYMAADHCGLAGDGEAVL